MQVRKNSEAFNQIFKVHVYFQIKSINFENNKNEQNQFEAFFLQ